MSVSANYPTLRSVSTSLVQIPSTTSDFILPTLAILQQPDITTTTVTIIQPTSIPTQIMDANLPNTTTQPRQFPEIYIIIICITISIILIGILARFLYRKKSHYKFTPSILPQRRNSTNSSNFSQETISLPRQIEVLYDQNGNREMKSSWPSKRSSQAATKSLHSEKSFLDDAEYGNEYQNLKSGHGGWTRNDRNGNNNPSLVEIQISEPVLLQKRVIPAHSCPKQRFSSQVKRYMGSGIHEDEKVWGDQSLSCEVCDSVGNGSSSTTLTRNEFAERSGSVKSRLNGNGVNIESITYQEPGSHLGHMVGGLSTSTNYPMSHYMPVHQYQHQRTDHYHHQQSVMMPASTIKHHLPMSHSVASGFGGSSFNFPSPPQHAPYGTLNPQQAEHGSWGPWAGWVASPTGPSETADLSPWYGSHNRTIPQRANDSRTDTRQSPMNEHVTFMGTEQRTIPKQVMVHEVYGGTMQSMHSRVIEELKERQKQMFGSKMSPETSSSSESVLRHDLFDGVGYAGSDADTVIDEGRFGVCGVSVRSLSTTSSVQSKELREGSVEGIEGGEEFEDMSSIPSPPVEVIKLPVHRASVMSNYMGSNRDSSIYSPALARFSMPSPVLASLKTFNTTNSRYSGSSFLRILDTKIRDSRVYGREGAAGNINVVSADGVKMVLPKEPKPRDEGKNDGGGEDLSDLPYWLRIALMKPEIMESATMN